MNFPFPFRCLCAAGVAVTLAARADLLLVGHFPGNQQMVRLSDTGEYLGGWGGLFVSVGGVAVAGQDVAYTTEGRLGAVAVRVWNVESGRHVGTLTDAPLFGGPVGTFNGGTITVGENGFAYVPGSYFDPFRGTPPGKEGVGIARLAINQYVPHAELEPWIGYGTAANGSVTDMAVGANGDLYVLGDRGLLRFDGDSGVLRESFSSLPGIAEPVDMEVGADGAFYVLDGGNSIKRFDWGTRSVSETVVPADLGLFSRARKMDLAADGSFWVLADGGRNLVRVDAANDNVIGEVDLSPWKEGSFFVSGYAVPKVPEPGQIVLAGAGLGCLWLWGWRRRC